MSIGSLCCDSAGDKFDVYYPTALGQGGFQHPILTWGNGTNSLSSNYTYFLKHMASWEFVVIAAQDTNSGSGQTILDGANFLTAANSNPATTTVPCLLGVYGYLGYPTAWMMFQLQNDNYARGAFVNGTGELFFETKNWQLIASTAL